MRLALAAVLTLSQALPARAALDPCFLDQMVAQAVRVLQVVDHEVCGPDADGVCTLTGTVARSFRGDIATGTRVQTSFFCDNPHGLVGPTIFHDADAVAGAGAVELHTGASGGPEGYGWGLLTLDAPTARPAFRFEHMPWHGRC